MNCQREDLLKSEVDWKHEALLQTEIHNPHLDQPPFLVREQLRQGYETPFLLLDSAFIRNQVRRFKAAMPRVKPHFAVKSNPDTKILQILKEEGAGFEIASRTELDALLQMDIDAAQVFYSNPVKSSAYIQYTATTGLEWYSIDSIEELRKVHQIKPDAKFYLRIHTTNEGATFPLSEKFGAYPDDIERIIEEAASLKADLAGVTFHVGSQCTNIENWRLGIRAARQIFSQMTEAGLKPRLLNLGGGYPVPLNAPVPEIEAIGAVINTELESFPDTTQVIAEPGRFIVAGAGCLVTRVVGTTQRDGKRWLYLETGFYSGLMELKDGLPLVLQSDRDGPLTPWTIAGPTCDSIDVCAQNYPLPGNLREGDLIYIRSAGAYSNACATTFNGFPSPSVIVV